MVLTDTELYSLELPGDLGLTPLLTKDDLLGERYAALNQTGTEEERQRLRSSG